MKNKFGFVKGKLKRTLKKTLKISLREWTIYEEERTSLGKIVNPKVMEGQWHKRNKDHEQKRKKQNYQPIKILEHQWQKWKNWWWSSLELMPKFFRKNLQVKVDMTKKGKKPHRKC